ncbi:MAG: hypothetical protein JRD89_19010 [Deltaproteobacteria bacterium]|nr:hypothetical protein [Deltaproteobacteria bacterium]
MSDMMAVVLTCLACFLLGTVAGLSGALLGAKLAWRIGNNMEPTFLFDKDVEVERTS